MSDMEIEELLKRFKKRDLVQTYFFKMACRVFGPPKCRDRILIAAPMHVVTRAARLPDVRLPVLTPSPQKTRDKTSISVATTEQQFTTSPADRTTEKHDWVRERRTFRKMLDGIGNVSQWINNKPMVTELELAVAERERAYQKCPPASPERRLSPMPKVENLRIKTYRIGYKIPQFTAEMHCFGHENTTVGLQGSKCHFPFIQLQF